MSDHTNSVPTSNYTSGPLDRLGWWASALVALTGAISLIATLALAGQYYVLDLYDRREIELSDPAISSTEITVASLFVGFGLFFLAGGIVFLFWVYRASANIHAVDPSAMEITPGWGVGWNFIPIASLWKPYQAIRQIWQASHNLQAPESVPVPNLFVWWWTFWILTQFVNPAWDEDVSVLDGGDIDEAQWDIGWSTAEFVTMAAACYFLFRIIREITRVQRTMALNTASIFE